MFHPVSGYTVRCGLRAAAESCKDTSSVSKKKVGSSARQHPAFGIIAMTTSSLVRP